MTGYQERSSIIKFVVIKIILFSLLTGETTAQESPQQASQLTLCDQERLNANSFKGSRKSGIVEYRGDVEFCNPELALSADLMIVQQSQQRSFFKASGKPLTLLQQSVDFKVMSSANELQFVGGEQQLKLSNNVSLKLKQNGEPELSIKANLVNYDYLTQSSLQQTSQQKTTLQPKSIKATGQPLQIKVIGEDSASIMATAQHLSYEHQSGLLTLEGNIEFNQGGDMIKAPKILYNTRTREWEAPKVDNQRIEVILQP